MLSLPASNSPVKGSLIPPELLTALLDIEAIEKELAQRKLTHFLRQAWHVLEPSSGKWNEARKRNEPHWGFHVDAICEHLEAVKTGEIRNLLINEPPRHMKSLAVSVMFPVWTWLDDPVLRFLSTSYADVLAVRDSLRSRRLIQSSWFQNRWADRFELTGDQNQKSRYENNHTGYRIATSVGGVGTGEGGDIIIVDDPHKVLEAESDKQREEVLLWWDETMSSRLNDPKTGRKVIIMQRIHERDLSGHVLDSGDYVHLCIPMAFEHERKCFTSIGWEDPRKEEGELICPDRYGPEEVLQLERELGPYAASGQLQQNPVPRAGGMFDISKFQILDVPPSPQQMSVARYWDKAGTDSKVAKGVGAHTAGVKVGKITYGPHKDKFIILDVVRGQWSAGDREQVIQNTAQMDGKACSIYVEQEPGSGGKESAEATVRNLAGYTIQADRVTGDKSLRAQPYSAQQIAGNILLLKGEWNARFIKEHQSFPVGAQKDQVDATSGAFNKLAEKKRTVLSW